MKQIKTIIDFINKYMSDKLIEYFNITSSNYNTNIYIIYQGYAYNFIIEYDGETGQKKLILSCVSLPEITPANTNIIQEMYYDLMTNKDTFSIFGLIECGQLMR